MRILIQAINFTPELVGAGKYTGEMAEWLAARGHEVRVVTAPPFNPAWKVASGYSPWRYRREDHFPQQVEQSCKRSATEDAALAIQATRLTRPVRHSPQDSKSFLTNATRDEPMSFGHLVLLRCPLWVSQRQSSARRILHLASFTLSSFPAMLRQILWKPDVVIAIAPTLVCAPSAWLTGRLSGGTTWLHIQDFEIDAAFEMGLLRSKSLRRIVGWLEKKCMSSFDQLSTISDKMMMKLRQKVTGSSHCLLFQNWVDTSVIFPLNGRSPLKKKFGIPSDDVVILYSGTMAQKQGLEVLAETAQLLQSKEGVRFVFCGDGPAKMGLMKLATKLGNVLFFPLQPLDGLNDLLNLADIHLLPQRADAADLVMPSKLTGIMASGRPAIVTAHHGTQLAQVVEGKGLVVPPGDALALSAAIVKLVDDPHLRITLGNNARAYAVSRLDKALVLSHFEQQLQSCAKPN